MPPPRLPPRPKLLPAAPRNATRRRLAAPRSAIRRKPAPRNPAARRPSNFRLGLRVREVRKNPPFSLWMKCRVSGAVSAGSVFIKNSCHESTAYQRKPPARGEHLHRAFGSGPHAPRRGHRGRDRVDRHTGRAGVHRLREMRGAGPLRLQRRALRRSA